MRGDAWGVALVEELVDERQEVPPVGEVEGVAEGDEVGAEGGGESQGDTLEVEEQEQERAKFQFNLEAIKRIYTAPAACAHAEDACKRWTTCNEHKFKNIPSCRKAVTKLTKTSRMNRMSTATLMRNQISREAGLPSSITSANAMRNGTKMAECRIHSDATMLHLPA